MKRYLYLILCSYLFLAVWTSAIVPIFEVYDEVWHYPLVEHLATNGLRLPVQNPDDIQRWHQQGSQPPLYYLTAAILTSWVDTSNFETLHRLNPLPQPGYTAPDGNVNVVIHRYDLEAFPWHGTTLAVHVARFFSIALGLATVLVTYQLGRELFPDRPEFALGAAALNAFLPMFVLVSASVSNDNLSNLLGNLLLLLVVRLLRRGVVLTPHEMEREGIIIHWRSYVLLGLVTGAGLLSKLSIGLMIPVIALTLVVVSIRHRNWRPLVIGGAVSGGVTILVAGWWYWRNYDLYGDPTGLNVFLDIVGRRGVTPDLAQLWSERFAFLKTYVGAYSSINVLLPEVLYSVFYAVGAAALVGAAVFLVRYIRNHPLVYGVTLLWPLLTFVAVIRWTMQTPGTQGRLMFIALSALSVWMAVGLTWWLPQRYRRWVLAGIGGSMALVAFLAPVLLVKPAFVPPPDVDVDEPITAFSASEGVMGLIDYRVKTAAVLPDEYIHVDLVWQVLEPTSLDWSLYAHLVTPEGVIVGQRDVYPGGGRLATSDLVAGRAWENPLSIRIPRTVYTPQTLTVTVGWYYIPTGQRMRLPDGEETLAIGQVQLEAVESDVPNPIAVNFSDKIELIGYDLSAQIAAPGESITLTLYWRGMKDMKDDYVVFANIINKATLTKYAASNAMPANWTRPTSTWAVGEIVEDVHTLTVVPDAPPDIFALEVGLYIQDAAQTFPRLRTIPRVGEESNTLVHLSPIRITE